MTAAISSLPDVPIRSPATSLVEQPTTNMSPGFECPLSTHSLEIASISCLTRCFKPITAHLPLALIDSFHKLSLFHSRRLFSQSWYITPITCHTAFWPIH